MQEAKKILKPFCFGLAGFATLYVGSRAYVAYQEAQYYENLPFIKSAVAMVSENKGVVDLLGQPIKVGRISLRDGWSERNLRHLRLKVPLQGPNDRADLYAFAYMPDANQDYELVKAEMKFSKIGNKRLLVFESPRPGAS